MVGNALRLAFFVAATRAAPPNATAPRAAPPNATAPRDGPHRNGTRLGAKWRTGADAVATALLLFVKVPKCGSSTTAGVVRRIAARHGLKGARGEGEPFADGKRVSANHGWLTSVAPALPWPAKRKVFLFTVVRDPLARAVSQYFHILVSRRGRPHRDEHVVGALERVRPRLLCDYVQSVKHSSPDAILDDYDLVGVVEHYAETMTLLAARLSIPLADVVYLPAKNASAGGKDDHGARFIPVDPKQLARVRDKAGAAFEKNHSEDYALWRGATARVLAAADGEAVDRRQCCAQTTQDRGSSARVEGQPVQL